MYTGPYISITWIITLHTQGVKWWVMHLLLSVFGDVFTQTELSTTVNVVNYDEKRRLVHYCNISWDGMKALALSPGPSQLFNLHAEKRELCFSRIHWKAGWSLGMRLRYEDATSTPGTRCCRLSAVALQFHLEMEEDWCGVNKSTREHCVQVCNKLLSHTVFRLCPNTLGYSS